MEVLKIVLAMEEEEKGLSFVQGTQGILRVSLCKGLEKVGSEMITLVEIKALLILRDHTC